MSPLKSPIRVAVTGGGFAGATLIFALLKYPHLDVHIFESAPAFREAGGEVGIARNALTALDLMGATACLERAGAVAHKGHSFMLAQGPDAGVSGVTIGSINADDHRHVVSNVQRAALLREVLKDVPEERMHAGKKLASVDLDHRGGTGAPMTIHFTDGTTHECDVLVGADGIHSAVRKIILGEDDPAAYPRATGWCALGGRMPYQEARAMLGKELVNVHDPRQYGWTGDGTWLMHGVINTRPTGRYEITMTHSESNVIDEGDFLSLLASFSQEEAGGSDVWWTTISADEIRSRFEGWPPHLKTVVERGDLQCLCDQPDRRGRLIWEHLPARTYVAGPVCVTGDAAHATSPWQGAGAGMAIEDSLVLSALLGHAKSSSEAVLALKAYDQVRRPRTQKIVESSRGTGIIRTGRDKEIGLDLEQNRQKLLPRWDFIIDFDNRQHCEDVVAVMDELVKNSV